MALDSHRSVNLTVNHTFKGPRLHTPYENLKYDDLTLHYSELYNYFIIYHNIRYSVQSLGQEDPLEEGMATHSNILAWRIPWTEEPGRLQSTGSQRVGHN